MLRKSRIFIVLSVCGLAAEASLALPSTSTSAAYELRRSVSAREPLQLCSQRLEQLREALFHDTSTDDHERVPYARLHDAALTLSRLRNDDESLPDAIEKLWMEVNYLLWRGDTNFSYFFSYHLQGRTGIEHMLRTYGRRGRLFITLRDFTFISRHSQDNVGHLLKWAPRFTAQYLLRSAGEAELWSLMYLSRYLFKSSRHREVVREREEGRLRIAYGAPFIGFDPDSGTRPLMFLPPTLTHFFGEHDVVLLPSIMREISDGILSNPMDAPAIQPAFDDFDQDLREQTLFHRSKMERVLKGLTYFREHERVRHRLSWLLAEAFVSQTDMLIMEDREVFDALSQLNSADDRKEKSYEGVRFRILRLRLGRDYIDHKVRVVLYDPSQNAQLGRAWGETPREPHEESKPQEDETDL